MTKRAKRRWLAMSCGMLLLIGGGTTIQLPATGAALVLHPWHRPMLAKPPEGCFEECFTGDGVTLNGWRGRAVGSRRGTLIYLHGVADNRASGTGVLERYRQRGFDVVAYDSRAQGQSSGDAVTYGYYEKMDLKRVIDALEPGPIVLVGGSLGAAIALQAAAIDHRITAVVAAETFSDLRTVVTERAPFCFTHASIVRALQIAEKEANFQVDEVSPVEAARKISASVLVIHGAADVDTMPEHSRRVFEALAGPKQLIMVPGAGHSHSLDGNIWDEIDRWIDKVVGM